MRHALLNKHRVQMHLMLLIAMKINLHWQLKCAYMPATEMHIIFFIFPIFYAFLFGIILLLVSETPGNNFQFVA